MNQYLVLCLTIIKNVICLSFKKKTTQERRGINVGFNIQHFCLGIFGQYGGTVFNNSKNIINYGQSGRETIDK